MEGGALPATSTVSGCQVSGIDGNYNGHLVTADIKVPDTYDCDTASATGCWTKIKMTYTAGAVANDTTTWAAKIIGDPVRLIE
jgi:hypothetical protein